MKYKINCFIILLIVLLIAIPSVSAFYYFNFESSLISKFIISNNDNNTYVRATVLTYWVDTTSCTNDDDYRTCDITGKSAWNIKPTAINSSWTLLDDGYYYYANKINQSEITLDNIESSNIVLIDSTLSFNELSDEYITGNEIVPQYEILYDFVSSDVVETTWGVTYENGIPALK